MVKQREVKQLRHYYPRNYQSDRDKPLSVPRAPGRDLNLVASVNKTEALPLS
jgi:hypothetical protein